MRVKLGDIDEVTLDVSGTVVGRLDALPEAADAQQDPGDDDEDATAGPIAIAVDLSENNAVSAASDNLAQ